MTELNLAEMLDIERIATAFRDKAGSHYGFTSKPFTKYLDDCIYKLENLEELSLRGTAQLNRIHEIINTLRKEKKYI